MAYVAREAVKAYREETASKGGEWSNGFEVYQRANVEC
jgi:hypothetical protein